LDERLKSGRYDGGGTPRLTEVDFWYHPVPGQFTFVVRIGAGVVWRRVGTLASPCMHTRRFPTQGDASVPTPPNTTPAPTRTMPFPDPTHEKPTLKRLAGLTHS